MLRLFIAVDLPAEIREQVARMMNEVHNARWVKAEQLHITLRFLGDTPEAELPANRDRLARVHQPPFAIKLRGPGVFPEISQTRGKTPKVLWLGIEPAVDLAALKQAVDDALAIETTKKSMQKQDFSPHLTLARFPSPTDTSLSRFLATNKDYFSPDWCVDHFHLYQSTLRPEGALHEQLASYRLAQSPYRE